MPKDLNEALMMDLKGFQLQDEGSLRAYLGWLISEVYMQKSGDMSTYTHKYINECKQKGLNVNDELVNLSPLANKYLRIDDLLNHITKYVLNGYLTINAKDNENINTFYDVIGRTLTYYQNKFDINSEKKAKELAVEILRNYLIYDRIEVFSKSNGTRDYVIKNGKNNIIEEMKMCTNYAEEDINITIDDYSFLAAYKWISSNQNIISSSFDDAKQALINNILNAKLNDKQKSYLLDELEHENTYALEYYVPAISGNLIESYKKSINSSRKI